jgi:hypothetical protein
MYRNNESNVGVEEMPGSLECGQNNYGIKRR